MVVAEPEVLELLDREDLTLVDVLVLTDDDVEVLEVEDDFEVVVVLVRVTDEEFLEVEVKVEVYDFKLVVLPL